MQPSRRAAQFPFLRLPSRTASPSFTPRVDIYRLSFLPLPKYHRKLIPHPMSSLASEAAESPAFKPFTKAERIQQLNDIDKVSTVQFVEPTAILTHLQSITQLLQSAGLALKTLTSTQETLTPAPSDRRAAFESASNSYFQALQTVDVGLRRQIIGLEEADIIPADRVKGKGKESQDPFAGGKSGAGTDQAAEGGMGKLDIGWLNSRSSRVGRDMEAELWEKARRFLDGLESGNDNGQGEEDKDEEMIF
jgi:hypothetical protein